MPFAWSWYSREFIETPPIPPGISRTQMFPFDSVRLALPWEVVTWACTSCRPELYPLTSQRGPSRSTKLSANSFWRGACLAKKEEVGSRLSPSHAWSSPVCPMSPEYPRWLLKINTEVRGRGVAFFDVNRLPCIRSSVQPNETFASPQCRSFIRS